MKVNYTVLQRGFELYKEEYEEAAMSVLRSGWYVLGPEMEAFETAFAEYMGVKHCIAVNSGTDALILAFRALGLDKGDEVIVPAYTYTATASVVCHVGAKLVLADVQKESLEMDYEQLENAITERTKVIIPVDLGGIPCDYDRIFSIVEGKKRLFHPDNEIQKAIGRVVVMADSAHAFGAVRKRLPVGSVADFSNFSFHAVKNFTTAEGGAVVWREIDGIDTEIIYQQYQLLSLHGQSKSALDKNTPGQWEYDVVGPWYKCNMTDIAAGIGLAQMKRYPEMLRRRKEIIKRYDAAFRPLGVEVLPHYTEDYQSSGHLYLTRIPGITEEQRQEIMTKMAMAGVACNVHYKPLPLLTAYKNLGFHMKDYPNAYERFRNEITLPLYTKLTDEEVDYVIENYTRIVKTYR